MKVWRWPILVAGLTTLGLISALLGEGGAWWSVSWITLSTPLLIIFYCIMRSR